MKSTQAMIVGEMKMDREEEEVLGRVAKEIYKGFSHQEIALANRLTGMESVIKAYIRACSKKEDFYERLVEYYKTVLIPSFLPPQSRENLLLALEIVHHYAQGKPILLAEIEENK